MNMEIRPNRLRYCLENGLPSLGARVESPWAYITEIAASTRYFDFIEYEEEYAPFTELDIEDICRCAELYGCSTVVKVDRQNRYYNAQRAIACGANGILFADMYTAEEVAETIDAITTSYPSGGIFGRPNRRLGMNGSGRMRMSDYRKMTDDVVKMIMIEKGDAMENLEAICKVKGVDMVCFGPFDYATNVGWEMDKNAEDLDRVHKDMIRIALAHGVQPLVQLDYNKRVQEFYDLGVRHFTMGDEVQMQINFYAEQCPDTLKILKK